MRFTAFVLAGFVCVHGSREKEGVSNKTEGELLEELKIKCATFKTDLKKHIPALRPVIDEVEAVERDEAVAPTRASARAYVRKFICNENNDSVLREVAQNNALAEAFLEESTFKVIMDANDEWKH